MNCSGLNENMRSGYVIEWSNGCGLREEFQMILWVFRCTVARREAVYGVLWRLQWHPCGSWWIWQSTDACRHSWKIWPQDTRVAAITGSFLSADISFAILVLLLQVLISLQ